MPKKPRITKTLSCPVRSGERDYVDCCINSSSGTLVVNKLWWEMHQVVFSNLAVRARWRWQRILSLKVSVWSNLRFKIRFFLELSSFQPGGREPFFDQTMSLCPNKSVWHIITAVMKGLIVFDLHQSLKMREKNSFVLVVSTMASKIVKCNIHKLILLRCKLLNIRTATTITSPSGYCEYP